MTPLTDTQETAERAPISTRAKMHMLVQMAEALEDEAAGLYRRAAVYEEEEFLLEREVEERQTEINRLTLKLNALRADRDALLARIDALADEAEALREAVYCNEEAQALAALERADARASAQAGEGGAASEGAGGQSLYFRRAELADAPQ